MFESIKEIKNFGIYKDFGVHNEIDDFKKYNLIYGGNGSGKTTLSRIFSSIETKCMFEDFNSGRFKLKLSNGKYISSDDLSENEYPIKVFNKDFIKDNIFFDNINKNLNPLVYISKTSVDKVKEIKELKEQLEILLSEGIILKDTKEDKEKEYNTFLQNQARDIKNDFGAGYVTYDKNKIKSKIDNGVDKLIELSTDSYTSSLETIKITDKKNINIGLSKIDFLSSYGIEFTDMFEDIKKLCENKIIANVIQELKDDDSFHKWVQEGIELHNDKKSKNKCLFCSNDIKDDLFIKYSEHFNDELNVLDKTLDKYIIILKKFKDKYLTKIIFDSSLLFPELKVEFIDKKEDFNFFTETFEKIINDLISILEKKRKQPYDIVNFNIEYDNNISTFNGKVLLIDDLIISNNEKVKNLSTEIKEAKEKVENHLIRKCFYDNNLKDKEEYIKKTSQELIEKRKLYDEKNKKLIELNKETTDIGLAIDKINDYIKDFFSRADIFLELGDDNKGYIIKRNNIVAKHLSEGERTAIALSFFLASINEKGFEKSKGIFFIDDPISSLDSNFIFHTFSLIKNIFTDVEQLFISTHNFEFFTLIKDWLGSKGIIDNTSFYEIYNFIDGDERYGSIDNLNKLLKNHKTEYHFLFSELKRFTLETDEDLKDYYGIGNITRRFLEIYLHFKVPNQSNIRSKLDNLLDGISYCPIRKEKLYKIINDYSHFSKLEKALMHNGREEIQSGIMILFDVLEKTDDKHYNILNREI